MTDATPADQHSTGTPRAGRADRVLFYPPSDARESTPYRQAHLEPARVASDVGGSVLTNDADAPYGDGTATAVVVLFPVPVDQMEALLAANPSVSWVQLPFAGIERYVPLIRARRDITWTSAKGCYGPPVAEHALMLTLALLRNLPERLRATSWGAGSGRTLNGLHAVVVGGGGIAREYLRLLKTWDTTVTVVRRTADEVPGADRTVTQDRLDEVLPEADVVMLAAAATDQTRGIIGRRQLELMDSAAVLVNIARGTLVDTDALVEALSAGAIHGAGLDVTDPEPLPDGHPLWTEPRCIVTPHTADTPEMCIPLINARTQRNLAARAQGGELEGQVDPESGY
ncbi:D-isomer specific 2-hydroxyacid dehydrogenase family protein [Citricoccus sp. GCM10030269]|uniref:D-isomer specific 2-hydroxyacid dehydrogenase family protein n=1 Tax=Citricoccus sp. GCM10030269 TaxID=3273388 RepID=UPI00361C040F